MDVDLHRREMDDYLDALNAVMYSRDREGRYLMVNEEFIRSVHPRTREDIIGHSDEELWPDRATDYHNNDLVVWNTEKPFAYQETGTIQDVEHVFLVFKFPLCKGKTMYAVGGLAVDITEAMEEMREAMGLITRLMAQLDQSQAMLRAMQMLLPQ